jgi:hypothetical protein
MTSVPSPVAARIPTDESIALDLRFPWPPAPERPAVSPSAPTPDASSPAPRQPLAWLMRVKPTVVACVHEFGDPDAHTASISLNFDRHGLLTAAPLVRRKTPRVSDCIVARLADLRFPRQRPHRSHLPLAGDPMNTHSTSLPASLCAAVTLLTQPVQAAPEPAPAALITSGEAKLAAGDRTGAVADLLQAHRGLHDPLTYRTERGDLVAVLRTELLELYRDTGAPEHLCQLRALLIAHIEALLVALGPDAGPAAVVGSRTRLREAGELLAARHPRTHCACDVWQPHQRPLPMIGADDPIRIALPPPTPTRPSPPKPSKPPPRLIAGSVLTGAGLGLAGLLGVSLGSYILHHAAIRRIVADDQAGRPYDESAVQMHTHAAKWTREAAIGLGVATTAVLSAGLGLLINHRRERRTRLHLSAGLPGAALSWYLTF